MQVFVTVILSYFVFHDQLAMLEYIGMALIMLGMFAVSFGNFKETKAKARPDSHQLLINTDA